MSVCIVRDLLSGLSVKVGSVDEGDYERSAEALIVIETKRLVSENINWNVRTLEDQVNSRDQGKGYRT